ncbi:MAG: hypothetical protein D6692_00855 [Planctomycetota bacterium]|nr:MAG: hypothetical protein D6692_00855 [Planctomycetota bacterium]
MFIRKIVIEGVEGDVEIERTETGWLVRANGVEAELDASAGHDERWAMAWNAAKVICGTTRRGDPNATRSMIHDVLCEIERVTDR